jgi:hypothetical protein
MAKPSSEEGGRKRTSALSRVLEAALGEERPVGRPDDPARERYPALWEWLTLSTDPKGDFLITPATISIQLGPEGVLATVTLRDLKYSCGAATHNLDDVFAALEAALTSENPPIRTWGKDEPNLRKKRRK